MRVQHIFYLFLFLAIIVHGNGSILNMSASAGCTPLFANLRVKLTDFYHFPLGGLSLGRLRPLGIHSRAGFVHLLSAHLTMLSTHLCCATDVNSSALKMRFENETNFQIENAHTGKMLSVAVHSQSRPFECSVRGAQCSSTWLQYNPRLCCETEWWGNRRTRVERSILAQQFGR